MNKSVQFKWSPQPKFLLLVCALLPLTVSAGFWQLDRAEQKRAALEQQDLGAAMPAQKLTEMDSEAIQNYTRVFMDGVWSEELFLLDNRMRSGRVGYEVLGVLRAENHLPVLVNRGWIDGGNDRAVLPKIDPLFGEYRVEGYLYRSAQKPLVVADQIWENQWPETLQAIDFDLMAQRTGEKFFPSVMRIGIESPLAFRADWAIERDGPGMHIGYAVQWFLMSLTVVIMTIFASSNLWEWLRQDKAPN